MLQHKHLLQVQRDLYDIPRGPDRFNAYIGKLKDPKTDDMALPLGPMNPMGKDHIPELLDRYLALKADEVAQQIVDSLQSKKLFGSEAFQTALVIADDAHGQWTNHIATDFNHRFDCRPMFRRGWLVGLLWTSETPSIDIIEKTIREAIYRGVHIQKNGLPSNLGQLIKQEGFAQANAGGINQFDDEELEYTQQLLEPLFTAEDEPTLIAAIYGDPAAHELGHQPLGLSKNAGLELGLHLQKISL